MLGFDIPWRLIGIVAGAALLIWACIWITGRIRVSYQAELERDQAIEARAAYHKLVEQESARAKLRQLRDQEADARFAGELEAAHAANDELRAAAARVPPTVETPDASGQPRLRINPVWWLCQSAKLSGDPTDAAACKTRSGTARVRPRTSARRLPLSAGVRQPRGG